MKKTDMLKKNKEFRYVVSRGKSFSSPMMVMICVRNRTGVKAGFSVSSKLGNAVTRNRTKRILRAGLTPLWPCLKPNTAYLFIARKPLLGQTSDRAGEEMRHLLEKAGMLL